jgi:hypothetical protein
MIFSCSSARDVFSNPTRNIAVCPLYSSVFVLSSVDISLAMVRSPSKESYRMFIRFAISQVNSEFKQVRRPNAQTLKKKKTLRGEYFGLLRTTPLQMKTLVPAMKLKVRPGMGSVTSRHLYYNYRLEMSPYSCIRPMFSECLYFMDNCVAENVAVMGLSTVPFSYSAVSGFGVHSPE